MPDEYDYDDDDDQSRTPPAATPAGFSKKRGKMQGRAGGREAKQSFLSNAFHAGLEEFGETAMSLFAEAGFDDIPFIRNGFNILNEKYGKHLTNSMLIGADVTSRAAVQSALISAKVNPATAEMLAEVMSGVFQGLRTANVHLGGEKGQQAIRQQFGVASQMLAQRFKAFTYADAAQALDTPTFADLDKRLAAMTPEQLKSFEGYKSQLANVNRLRKALELTQEVPVGTAPNQITNVRVEQLLKFLARHYKADPPKEENPLVAGRKILKNAVHAVGREVVAIASDSKQSMANISRALDDHAEKLEQKNAAAKRKLDDIDLK